LHSWIYAYFKRKADATFSAGKGTRSSPQIGIDLMVAELKNKAIACPKQKYILGGHSQGGGVTVGAIRRLPTEPGLPKDAISRIIAVTMFGSPKCPDLVKDRCLSYCHKGDFVSELRCSQVLKSILMSYLRPATQQRREMLLNSQNWVALVELLFLQEASRQPVGLLQLMLARKMFQRQAMLQKALKPELDHICLTTKMATIFRLLHAILTRSSRVPNRGPLLVLS